MCTGSELVRVHARCCHFFSNASLVPRGHLDGRLVSTWPPMPYGGEFGALVSNRNQPAPSGSRNVPA